MNDVTYIAKSTIEGRGTFVKKDIKKGQLILNTTGIYVPTKDFDKQVNPKLQEVCFQVDKTIFICPLSLQDNNGIFSVNHSCQPNAGIKNKISLVALREIQKDEEVTFDYCMTDANFPGMYGRPHPAFTCHCGSGECRKTISGEDWMNPELQEKYKGYFSTYIKELINSSK